MADLPDGWKSIALGDAAQWLSGGTPRTSEPSYWNGDIPWISAASLTNFYIKDSDRRVTELGAANGTRLVDAGTVLFVVRGMSLKTEFRIGIAQRRVAFGQDCKALIALPGIDPYFLAYALKARTAEILAMVDEAGHGTGRLQTDRLQHLPLALPPLDEQQAIVEVLSALDDKIAVNERIATTVDRLAEAEYVRSTGKATETVLLGDLLDLKYGKALPATSRSPGDVPVYGSGGIVGMHNQHLVDGPGIVVGRKGTVGAVYWSQQKFFPIDTTFYVEVRRSDVPMEFLFFMLRKLGLDSMNSDSAVPGLNRANALALKTHLPQQDELARFADKIRPLFELKHSLSVQSNCLKELRDTLLPKLMSGELRVRDAEKAVEEAL